MEQLRVEDDKVVNLPDDFGDDARIASCETPADFDLWCNGEGEQGETMAARHAGEVYVKIPQQINDDGEFSLEYDCVALDEANKRIERWSAAR